MQSQRCQPQQIYKETSLILRCNNFSFLLLYFGDTSFDVQKVEIVCFYICCLLSVFPNNSGRIWPIELKIGMLHHMNNTF